VSVIDAFCGIDVACAKNKPLPIVVCVRESTRIRTLPLRRHKTAPPRGMGNRLAIDGAVRQQFADDVAGYLARVEESFGVRIAEVAIDAPRMPSVGARRAAEQAMDMAGISCFITPTRAEFAEVPRLIREHLAAGGSESSLPRANQLWMLVGFDLFTCLEQRYNCIEVFPNAIVRQVAPGAGHKSTAQGFQQQLLAIAAAAGWDASELPLCAYGLRHDKLDAFMSAWIASLPAGERVPHGDGLLDTIWSLRWPVVRAEPGYTLNANL
jgi:hypothetical protein